FCFFCFFFFFFFYFFFVFFFFFFFSSRRRHTRSDRDWSSDVCSSDLLKGILMSTLAKLVPRKLIISVVMISFTPKRALRKAGISDQAAPTKNATTRQTAMVG